MKKILFVAVVILSIVSFNYFIKRDTTKTPETASQNVVESTIESIVSNDDAIKETKEIPQEKNITDSSTINTQPKNISTPETIEPSAKNESKPISSNTQPKKTDESIKKGSNTSPNTRLNETNEPSKATDEISEPSLNDENKKEEQSSPKKEIDSNEKIATNDPFYSIHQGRIEFKTKQSCLNACEEVGFLDTVDIKNLGCFEIISKSNTIMGYYLKVYCESGNCDRYKTMIDLSKFNQ